MALLAIIGALAPSCRSIVRRTTPEEKSWALERTARRVTAECRQHDKPPPIPFVLSVPVKNHRTATVSLTADLSAYLLIYCSLS